MTVTVSLVFISLLTVSCNRKKTINDELKEAATSMNKLMPQVLNEGIRLDSVSAEKDKVFKYNYTLTDDVKENVTPEAIDLFKKTTKSGALDVVKTSDDMKDFRDNGVTMKYVYYDKNGKLMTDFTITKSEYGNK